MEFTEAMYRSAKLRQYYGVTLYVDPGPAREHLAMLKGEPYYMSNQRISELAGLSASNLCQIIKGRRGESRGYEVVKEIHRDTEAAVLGVRPEIDASPGQGGHVPPHGARRRLQALIALGFPLAPLGEGIGWTSDPQPVHRFIRGKAGTKFVMHSTHLAVVALYDKLSSVDPADLGHPAYSVSRAKRSAARHGYAPPSCWDEDTIDDPDALPEWTGACGTEEGYRIHVRETFFKHNPMPPCDPCRATVETRDPGEPSRISLNRENLTEAMKASPLTGLKIAEAVFGEGEGKRGRDTLYRWRDGSRAPRSMTHVETLSQVLDVDYEFLVDIEATRETAERERPGQPGAFNPHVLRTAMDLAGMSFCRAGELPGSTVSKGAVNSWASGTSIPRTKDKVKFLADHFGVDVEVFYS